MEGPLLANPKRQRRPPTPARFVRDLEAGVHAGKSKSDLGVSFAAANTAVRALQDEEIVSVPEGTHGAIVCFTLTR